MRGDIRQHAQVQRRLLTVRGAARARRFAPAVLLVALLIGAGGCQATRPRGREEVGGMKIDRIGGYVELVARDRRRDQRSKVGAADYKYEETIFEENVQLEMEGDIYHPNFAEFSAAALFGLLQFDYDENFGGRERSQSTDGDVQEFDVSFDLFKKKSYPGSVYARRYQSLEARPFQSSLQTTTTNYGLVWQYVDEKTPTSFQFNHTDVVLDPLASDEATGRQRNTNARFETAYRVNDQNAFSFWYNHLETKEEPFELDYDSDELSLSHQLGFAPSQRGRLESEINYFDQRGTFAVERLRWRELLRFDHTDDLRSRFTFELTDRQQGSLAGVEPIGERSYRVTSLLEHELYDSLVSQLQLYGHWQRFDSGLNIDRYGAFASFNYRKTNPLGVLLADYRIGVQREERTGGDQTIEILDERHTFTDPEPILLANTNVDVDTITMTAEDRITFYYLGRDFTIRQIGDRVEIERVPTGRILDGEVVLIDYLFEVLGEFTLDTLTQNFDVRQDFDFGLSPYYRLRWQDQTLTPDQALGSLAEDITSQTVGVEYRWQSLHLMAEYQDFDSNITPYTAIRVGGDYSHRFEFGATGRLRARWTDLKYFPPNERQTRFFSLEGRYRHPIKTGLTIEAVALYRNEDDSLTGPEEGVDVDLSLEWIVRDTEFRVTYEYGNFDNQFSENDYQTVFVQLRRRF